MAAGTLPMPGTEYGPCLGPCVHLDCAETREMAATDCRICGEQIGYGDAFYRESAPEIKPRVLAHADCAEIEVENERAAGAMP